MINFKSLLETVYEPKSGDEKNFKDKHIVVKYKTPYDTESQFTSNLPKAKRKADHDKGEDENVYEAAEVHTKRADKQAVIVRAVDPKTGESKAKVVQRRAGEIKIGEEVELEESITKMSDARLKFHATKNVPHGSYTRKEVEDEHKRRMKTDGASYASVKPSLNEDADLDEAVNEKQIKKDLDSGMSHDVVIGKHANKKLTNTDEIRKVIQQHAWNKRMKKEELDLDEKVKNPYAIGMAAAMKATGDTPPLKKSTIVKGHEIAKSIKNEAMDPVGKADADINNDGKVDGSDKYLHARRKAISKALRKEEVEQIDEISKKTLGSYVKKAASDVANKASEHDVSSATQFGPEVRMYRSGLRKDIKKREVGMSKALDRLTKEEVEQIDELSPNTLHSYIKKAAGNMAGNAAVAAAQASSSMKKSSPDVKRNIANRMKGITGASGRLADKANMAEEAELDEVSDKKLDAYRQKAFADQPAGDDGSDKYRKRKFGRDLAFDKQTGRAKVLATKESVDLDEAFKIGAMKLKDGSSVTLTRESAEVLNSLFNQLNGANKSKMEERMMSGKKGFQEILSFAENI